ncbi:hypothetical protein [Winogradskyella bathintestinalis]|uniref:Uncharacterized protein n=1 Tax=Winogradskyella bathintestinalis TaxID=3035208 RepID=A0ABT7ZYY2_9FLAO|nr:hypothetical protein [Winogradskyella bathintestinalis]MDN3494208.1 hypothetical protein [Winogradskyella bathintestinalis]
MGILIVLENKVDTMIDEMESDSDYSRSQKFLEEFWDLRNELQEEKDSNFGNDKKRINKLLDLLNRKGKENDMENW